MNIAILGTRGIPARYGGFETFAEQLGSRLVKRGHSVTVFCEPSTHPLTEHRGVRLEYVSAPQLGPLRTLVFDARCLWRARKLFDLVYMLGYGASPFCFIPRIWGTQVWINMDGLEWARAKWSKLAKLYLKTAEAIAVRVADGLIADAHAISAYLTSAYPNMKPCRVIPYGAPVVRRSPDVAPLASFGLKPESYYLVVCRLEPENHIKEIVDGFSRTNGARPLVVVGNHKIDNPYMRQVRALAGPRVRFIGPVYEPAVLQALRFYTFTYVHGHSVGGTNPSLLEAMGCANTVIAHDNCFNREVLGSSGLFFSNPAQLGESIRWLEEHAAARLRLKAEVVRRIEESYTWDAVTEQYSQLFCSVTASSSANFSVAQRAPEAAQEKP